MTTTPSTHTANTEQSRYRAVTSGTVLTFRRWADTGWATMPGSFPADTDDTLVYLAPILGPSATLILHRVARYLTAADVVEFDVNEFRATFGNIAPSQLAMSLQRIEMFGYSRLIQSTIEVRDVIPPISDRHIKRWPTYLADAYHARGRA